MGKVAVTINVSLESPETNAEKVAEQIKEETNAQDVKIKELGFGLKTLEVLVVFDDKEGGSTDEIEKKIMKIEGVANTESGEATLI